MPSKIDTRYGQNPGSGANEPKHSEKKERRPDWIHRQGDQSRPGTKPLPEEEARDVNTKGAQQTGTMPHLEGAEQGPR
jgi:hypothetical protein